MKKQPTKIEIRGKLESILQGELTQEYVGDWAMDYIVNDYLIEMKDLNAWKFLMVVSGVGERIALDKYLYCEADMREWIERFAGN